MRPDCLSKALVVPIVCGLLGLKEAISAWTKREGPVTVPSDATYSGLFAGTNAVRKPLPRSCFFIDCCILTRLSFT